MLNSKSVARGIVLAMSMLPVALPVMAQEYPVKAIRFIAPNLPGGPTDILARLLGQKISETFGHPVVENSTFASAAPSPTLSNFITKVGRA